MPKGGSRTLTTLRTTDFKSRERGQPNLTKQYKPVFMWSGCQGKASGWLSNNTYHHHLSPMFTTDGMLGGRKLKRISQALTLLRVQEPKSITENVSLTAMLHL